jgi:hypothetical protein
MKKTLCIIVLIAVSTLPASAQRNRAASSQKTDTTPSFVPTHEGPYIVFEKQTHDYGQIVQGADGSSQFKFKNTGSEPLILANVQASCGCTSPSWPREPILPGQEAVIVIRYDTNRIGHIGRAVTVFSNSVGGNERITLRLAGNVTPKQN